jgi:peptidoglycan/xylan/chitin deacetylase (PgdA/CDA1 family)
VREFPETRFVLAGSAHRPDYLEELQALACRLGIEQNVIFMGDCLDVAALLAVTDISVIASMSEGFSNTVLESMAAGVPVVATNTGGTPEAVIDGTTGLLVPPCDATALGDAILRLLRNEPLRRSMGVAGRRRARTVFDERQMINKNEQLYEQALAEKQERPSVALRLWQLVSYVSLRRLVKSMTGAGMRYSGVIWLLRRTLPRQRRLKILAYHRISNQRFDPLLMNLPVPMFEAQLQYLRRHYLPVSLDEAVAALSAGCTLPPETVVLTFDDGYRDNYINAFPLLKKYQMRATVFLTAGAIDTGDMLWYDRVAAIIRAGDRTMVDLRDFGFTAYPLNTIEEKARAIRRITSRMKYRLPAERQALIAALARQLQVDALVQDPDAALLTWDEIREMQRGGVSFGSHGMHHTILTVMSAAEAVAEIRSAKQLIEEKLQTPVEYFAYPNGHGEDFNDQVKDHARSIGYRAACALEIGAHGPVDLFALDRFCVTAGMMASATGRFSAGSFEVALARQQ